MKIRQKVILDSRKEGNNPVYYKTKKRRDISASLNYLFC